MASAATGWSAPASAPPPCWTASARSTFSTCSTTAATPTGAPRGTPARGRFFPNPYDGPPPGTRDSRSTPGARRFPSWSPRSPRAARRPTRRAFPRRAPRVSRWETGSNRVLAANPRTTRVVTRKGTRSDAGTPASRPPARHRAPARAVGVHDPRGPGPRLLALHARRRHGGGELRRRDPGLLRGARRHAQGALAGEGRSRAEPGHGDAPGQRERPALQAH